jgi:hypothetical protein
MKQLMPQFMRDNSQNDGHAEPVMDYVISWCLRRADVICKDEKPILYSHCRYMLAMLLGLPDYSNLLFRDVKVWKQDQKIDLRVEVDVEQMGKITKYALLIENKYYTGLHDTTDIDGKRRNQLEVYKKNFDAHYNSQSETWQKHYALITCIERNDSKFEQYRIAEEFDFNLFSFYELLENDIQTESDLFNEFWYRWGDARF